MTSKPPDNPAASRSTHLAQQQGFGALAKPSTSLGEKSAPHLRSKQELAFQALGA
ncbi:hypothetical protein [Paenibacillus sp. NPDC058177]|uniref:hypothetical protein n=1 Tax=Paenibacillus sp. NPDC058177 TaxID=3346369 RepID=UPI0036DB4079